MHTSFTQVLRRAFPAAIAVAMIFFHHAPALADSAPQVQTCGKVDLATTSSADAAGDFTCFHNAFSGCQPATLYATGQNNGIATAWTFTTVNGGDDHGCSISEVVETSSNGDTQTDSYLCRTLSQDKDGTLTFGGCGTQKDVSLRVSSMASTAAAPGGTIKN